MKSLFHFSSNQYRRKPKPTIVPWTKETCPVGAVIKIKNNGNKYLILAAVDNHVLVRETFFTYDCTLMECTMEDGSPCGTVVDNTNEKPPLGLRPKVVYFSLRKIEVTQAINRYTMAGLEVPTEWKVELSLLNDYLSAMP